jgi:hypothetical protein
MDSDIKSKAQLEQLVADAEGDIKYAEGKLKAAPKSARYLGMLDGSKTQLENAREQLRELKDPNDQLRHKAERIRKLGEKTKKLTDDLRDACKRQAEAEEEADELREQIHDAKDEVEQLQSQQRILVLQGIQQGEPAAPVDLGVAVEAMRRDFDEMFTDTRMPGSAMAKKDEMEAGFVTMRDLVTMLASITTEYKEAKLKAEAPIPPIVARPAPPAPPHPEGAATSEGTQAGSLQATVAANPPTTTAAVRDATASQEERNSNRERTPPPARGSKGIAKKSDEELLGPRRAKLAKTAAAGSESAVA